jgi:FAD/FMN-containing dehydrogenase
MPTAAVSDIHHAQCAALLVALGKSVVYAPGSSGYNSSISSYYSQQEQLLAPACIVKPTSTSEVSSAVSILASKKPACTFAVRSGGHGVNAGFANIAGGVTIDLRNMNATTLNTKTNTASIQAGATWDQVYAALDPHNVSVAGGRNAGVGVGGLITGGGISFFSPRYGFSVDTVLNYEVVLANGTLVNANSAQNPDLLWGLKGGGNNFGIVTRVDMQAFPQGGMWGGVMQYDISQATAINSAMVELASSPNYDPYASVMLNWIMYSPVAPPLILMNIEYTKPVVNPPVLQGFTNITSLASTLRTTNMTDLALEFLTTESKGGR